MDKKQIFNQLVKIGKRSNGGRSGPWIASDLIHQDALFELQADYAELMLKIANDIGKDAVNKLVKEFPYLYTVSSAE